MFTLAIDQDRLRNAGQIQLAELAALSYSLLASAERLSDLNLHAAQAWLSQGIEFKHSAAAVEDVKTAYAASVQFGRPLLVSSLAYARGVYEIVAESREEMLHLLDGRLNRFNQEVADSLEQVAGAVPEGSESAVDAVKIALQTMNEAYEHLSAAGKQTIETIDAKVNAVAETLEEAVAVDQEAANDALEAGAAKPAAKARARKATKAVAAE